MNNHSRSRYFIAALLLTVATALGVATPAQANENLLHVGSAISLDLGMGQLDGATDDYKELYTAYDGKDKEITGTIDGKVELSVSIGDEAQYPELPNVKAPDGWKFIGWYDQPVYHMWWNRVNGKGPEDGKEFDKAWVEAAQKSATSASQVESEEASEDSPIASGTLPVPTAITSKNLKNLRSSDPNNFDSDSWWWRRLVLSAGKEVHKGDPATSYTLYAAYAPIQYKINYWYNGYGSQWNIDANHGCLQTYRDAYTTTYSLNLSEIEKSDGLNSYKFDTWQPKEGINVSIANDGTGYNYRGYPPNKAFVVNQNLDLYACYTKNGTEVVNTFKYPPATPKDANKLELQRTDHRFYGDNYLDPLEPQKVTLLAQLFHVKDAQETAINVKDGAGRLAPAYDSIQWTITQGDDLATLSVSKYDPRYAYLSTNGTGAVGQKIAVNVTVTTGQGGSAPTILSKTFTFTLTHNWGGTIHYEQDPTCENGGYNYTECQYCHKARKYHIYAPLGHWLRTVKFVTATCDTGGYTLKECVNCYKRFTQDPEPPKQHDMTKIVQYGCNNTMVITLKCNTCGKTETSGLDSLVHHDWSPTTVTLQAPTCTTAGSEGIVCEACGVVKSSHTIPAVAHTYSNYTVTKAATPTQDGVETRHCLTCGAEDTLTIPAITAVTDKNNKLSDAYSNALKQNLQGIDENLVGGNPSTPANPSTPTNPSGSPSTNGPASGNPSTTPSDAKDDSAPRPVPEVTEKVTQAVAGINNAVKDLATVSASKPDANGNVTFTVKLDDADNASKVGSVIVKDIVTAAKSASATKAELVGHEEDVSIDLTNESASIEDFVKNCLATLQGEVATLAAHSDQSLQIKVSDKDGASELYTIHFTSSPAADAPTNNGASDSLGNDASDTTAFNQAKSVYRLYNKWSGAHLITTDAHENDELKSLGWESEGVIGEASGTGQPVYRLFNQWSDEHFFTTDLNEYNKLKGDGWNGEGEAFKSEGSTPVYRLYNPYVSDAPNHLYSTSQDEYVTRQGDGWKGEDIRWYFA